MLLLLLLLLSCLFFTLFTVFVSLFAKQRMKIKRIEEVQSAEPEDDAIAWPEEIPVKIINLVSAHNRFRECLKSVERAGFGDNIERFEASNGAVEGPIDGLTAGEVGCYNSHRRLWTMVKDMRTPVLIVEDDASLLPNAYAFLKTFRANWDIVMLNCSEAPFLKDGDCVFGPSGRGKPIRLGRHHPSQTQKHRAPSCITGSICYVVTPKGAEQLLSRKRDPVDVLLAKAFAEEALIGYCMSPPLAIHSMAHFDDSQIRHIDQKVRADERVMMRAIRKSLPKLVERSDNLPIPNILHFNFGFKRGATFELEHYIAVASAIHHNQPDCVVFLYEHEPNGDAWQMLKRIVTPIQVKAPRTVFGRKLEHHSHKSDVVRLYVLNILGGIYLDLDTITLRSFRSLRENDRFVMAYQGAEGHPNRGLCNATMLAPPNSLFGKYWYMNYKTFDGSQWDYHSVQLPRVLANMPNLNLPVTVLDERAFFHPMWGDDFADTVFKTPHVKTKSVFAESYSIHLWESLERKKYKDLVHDWKSMDSVYGHHARQALESNLLETSIIL